MPASSREDSRSSEETVTCAVNETTLTLGCRKSVSTGASCVLGPIGVVAGALTLLFDESFLNAPCRSIAGKGSIGGLGRRRELELS